MILAALALALLGTAPAVADTVTITAQPEAKPFGHPKAAERDAAAAFARARANSHWVILVFGANWCHDSRSLAGWFATPRFKAMLADRYEIVWIDVGKKDKNIDLARRFGLNGIAGTPTVLITDAHGRAVNLADAPGWRNAASRSEDSIYAYFSGSSVAEKPAD